MVVDGMIDWGAAGPSPPSEGFDIEARSKAIYEWVRLIRGGVLAGAFTVERHLSAAITQFMLGERISRPAVLQCFNEGLLEALPFERRINAALLIAPHVWDASAVASFKGDLNQLRTLRNSLAHKPFWFHPELNKNNEVINLVPLMQRGRAPVPLTSKFVEQTNGLIRGLIENAKLLAEECACV